MFDERIQRILPFALAIVTVVLGTAGFMQTGDPFYTSLIESLSLLVLDGPIEPTNACVEIARWAGIIFAFDIVLSVVESGIAAFSEDRVIARRAKRADAIAVHGDIVLADKMAENLGERAIRSDRASSFEAPYQVLLFSNDEKAAEFFIQHNAELRKAKEAYVGLDLIRPEVATSNNVSAFSMADACAQMYWDAYPVNKPEKIALIGEGPYAEALFSQALLVNLFSVEGGVEYRIYGDFASYRNLHTHLDELFALNNDTCAFCDFPWQSDLASLASADRIILCGEPGANLRVASALRVAGVTAPALHIRCDTEAACEFVGKGAAVFGTTDELCTQAIVIQQEQHSAGKICDAAYRVGTSACNGCTLQSKFPFGDIADKMEEAERLRIQKERLSSVDFRTCITKCDNFKRAWQGMGEFLKRSNYAAAAMDAHRLQLLVQNGVDTTDLLADGKQAYMKLPAAVRDELQEIEHIRWCRFHYLNNWRYAPAVEQDGKLLTKNVAQRTHSCLVPYAALSSAEKAKDGSSYMTLGYRRLSGDGSKGKE